MNTNTPNTAEGIAKDLEQMTDPTDHSKIVPGSWDKIDADVQQAVDNHIADKVADRLEADGYGDAAQYVRDAASGNSDLLGDEDYDALLEMLFGDADDDE